MKKKPTETNTANALCPMSRSLGKAGESWTILILRDALDGLTRFDEFQKSLTIAPNMLTRRLNAMVADGLLERRQYQENPPRFEYVLTELGRDFRPVFLALMAWGNKHFCPEGETLILIDQKTGKTVDPILVDARNGVPITEKDHRLAAAPTAPPGVKARMAARAIRSAQPDTL